MIRNYEEKLQQLKINGLKNIALNEDLTGLKEQKSFHTPMIQFITIDDKLWLQDAQSGDLAPIEEVEELISFLQYSVTEINNYDLIGDTIEYYEDQIEKYTKKEDEEISVKQELIEKFKSQGYVYLIKGEFGRYKIGASKNPLRRVKELRLASSEDHKLIATIRQENMYWTESCMHEMFNDYKGHSEWFKLDEDALEYFLQIAESEDNQYEVLREEYGDYLKLEKIEIKGVEK